MPKKYRVRKNREGKAISSKDEKDVNDFSYLLQMTKMNENSK